MLKTRRRTVLVYLFITVLFAWTIDRTRPHLARVWTNHEARLEREKNRAEAAILAREFLSSFSDHEYQSVPTFMDTLNFIAGQVRRGTLPKKYTMATFASDMTDAPILMNEFIARLEKRFPSETRKATAARIDRNKQLYEAREERESDEWGRYSRQLQSCARSQKPENANAEDALRGLEGCSEQIQPPKK